MKFLKNAALSFALCCAVFAFTACGVPATTITLGVYDENAATFTSTTSTSGYTLEVSGTNLVLKGTIPYVAGVLGIDAGNIVAIKFKTVDTFTPDSSTSIQTTNRQDPAADGWNTYDQSALEADGSLIWVTGVSKDNNVQIKIVWNANTPEVIYTLTVDTTATMATA